MRKLKHRPKPKLLEQCQSPLCELKGLARPAKYLRLYEVFWLWIDGCIRNFTIIKIEPCAIAYDLGEDTLLEITIVNEDGIVDLRFLKKNEEVFIEKPVKTPAEVPSYYFP